MFKNIVKVLTVASLLIGGTALFAGETKTESKQHHQKPKSIKDIKISPEAEKAAYKLFEVLKIKEGIRSALDQSLEYQVKRIPAMAPYKDIYLKFFHKYTKWDDMKKDLAKLYASNFTVKELNELSKFYSSKVGQKSLVLLPRLTAVTMKFAQARIAKHAKELKEAVAKRAKELEKETK